MTWKEIGAKIALMSFDQLNIIAIASNPYEDQSPQEIESMGENSFGQNCLWLGNTIDFGPED